MSAKPLGAVEETTVPSRRHWEEHRGILLPRASLSKQTSRSATGAQDIKKSPVRSRFLDFSGDHI